jgi:hypothetical protein
MPRVGFEPTTPVFERAKIVYASDRRANVIGNTNSTAPQISDVKTVILLKRLGQSS